MIKVFLILTLLQLNILYAGQILLVVGKDFNSTRAKLFCFEGSKQIFGDIDVNLGRNGLAWGVDEKNFIHFATEPTKHEGDGKSPAGVFSLISSFGYDENGFSLPYRKSTADTICVDDLNSNYYNKIIKMPAKVPESFELMKRDDDQYKIGAVVDYNPKAVKGRGSCIFLHVQKEPNHPTAGCTSMRFSDLDKVLKWLDPNRDPLLIQVTKQYLEQVFQQFPQIGDQAIINTIK